MPSQPSAYEFPEDVRVDGGFHNPDLGSPRAPAFDPREERTLSQTSFRLLNRTEPRP